MSKLGLEALVIYSQWAEGEEKIQLILTFGQRDPAIKFLKYADAYHVLYHGREVQTIIKHHIFTTLHNITQQEVYWQVTTEQVSVHLPTYEQIELMHLYRRILQLWDHYFPKTRIEIDRTSTYPFIEDYSEGDSVQKLQELLRFKEIVASYQCTPFLSAYFKFGLPPLPKRFSNHVLLDIAKLRTLINSKLQTIKPNTP